MTRTHPVAAALTALAVAPAPASAYGCHTFTDPAGDTETVLGLADAEPDLDIVGV